MMEKDMGAIPGSREPDQTSGSGPPGFDPARVVGRVAQALWDQRCPGIRLDPEDVAHYEAQAREVIAAMREPEAAQLQPACDKHLPGHPMHDTTPPWPDERYRTDEECPRFVARRRIWASMIDAIATEAEAKDLGSVHEGEDRSA